MYFQKLFPSVHCAYRYTQTKFRADISIYKRDWSRTSLKGSIEIPANTTQYEVVLHDWQLPIYMYTLILLHHFIYMCYYLFTTYAYHTNFLFCFNALCNRLHLVIYWTSNMAQAPQRQSSYTKTNQLNSFHTRYLNGYLITIVRN